LRALLAHVDVIRLDHFRAFAAAWHVPAGAPTAQSGKWVAGPGADFFQAVRRELGTLPFIAEDLGLITPDVLTLRDQFGMPGMRVLQFAFDGRSDNPYLPDNYVTNAVVYTGTHDNPTTRAWFEELQDNQRRNLWNYLREYRGCGGADAFSLVVSGCGFYGSIAGFAQSGARSSDERSRPSRRQLGLARHGRDAVRSGVRTPSKSDEELEPVGSSCNSSGAKDD
jgi:hypothetical protein